MSETTKRIDAPKVKTHPIMEIVAKSMFGLNNCDCVYYQKMVNRCAKKVLEYHNTHLHQEVIRGKICDIRRFIAILDEIFMETDPHGAISGFIVALSKEIAYLTAELEGE